MAHLQGIKRIMNEKRFNFNLKKLNYKKKDTLKFYLI